ncbi:MAG: trypsin-like peptidase domain-containing protein [Patescibacteria group bacterium]|nr:trypsin-like peptidase domain-containing protein [Patescibacteria group bacterium]
MEEFNNPSNQPKPVRDSIDWGKWAPFLGVSIVAGIIGGIIGINLFGGAVNPTTVLNKSEQITLEEESATISAVDKVVPSVVSIVSTQTVRSLFGGTYQAQGGGTGFIISSDGLIATNKHVVSSQNATYQVLTADGKQYDMEIVSVDPVADLAIVRIQADNLPVVDLGNSDKLVLGQKVVAIGNALGEYQNTVTSGIVSGIGRVITAGDGLGSSERLEGVIQTDAAINPGNSGGPLINLSGQVVGINTAVDSTATGVGFAIPINSVKSALDSVLKSGEIVRPKLGVRYIHLTKEIAALNDVDVTEGALIAKGDSGQEAVESGGPADLAGLQEGDIITAINDDKITEDHSLAAVLQNFAPGNSVTVHYLRDGKARTTSVKLGKL